MLSSTTNSAFSGYCPSSNPTIPSLNNQVISYLNHINKSMRIEYQNHRNSTIQYFEEDI